MGSTPRTVETNSLGQWHESKADVDRGPQEGVLREVAESDTVDSWLRQGLTRSKGGRLGNDKHPSCPHLRAFAHWKLILRRPGLRKNPFSCGKSDTSLDKCNMAVRPLRTPNRQQAHSNHRGVLAFFDGAPAGLATPGHKASHSLGQQSGGPQPLRNSLNP